MFGFGPPTDPKARREWWRRHIPRQQESGIPVAEFCRRHGVHPTTFYAWRRRFGGSPMPKRPLGQRSTGPRPDANGYATTFLPVSLRDSDPTGQLEIALGNNRFVRLSGTINARLLRAAIRAVGQLDASEPGGD